MTEEHRLERLERDMADRLRKIRPDWSNFRMKVWNATGWLWLAQVSNLREMRESQEVAHAIATSWLHAERGYLDEHAELAFPLLSKTISPEFPATDPEIRYLVGFLGDAIGGRLERLPPLELEAIDSIKTRLKQKVES